MPVRIVEIWYSHQNDVLFRYEGEQTIYKAAPHRIKYFEDQKIIKADGTIDPRYARKNMAKTIDL